MAATGYRYPTSEAIIADTGVAWANISAIRADDLTYATTGAAANTGTADDVLEARNFGFSSAVLPDSATITKVEIQFRAGGPSNVDCGVNPRVGANSYGRKGVSLGGPIVVTTHDFTANKPGGWTPADFRDGTFVVRFDFRNGNGSAVTGLQVDFVRVQVTFDVASSDGTLAATEAKDTAAISGAVSSNSQSVQVYVGGLAVGTPKTNTNPALIDQTFDITSERAWKPSDFRDGTLAVVLGSLRGDAALISRWDCVSLRVTYATPPVTSFTGTLAAVEARDTATVQAKIVASGTLAATEAKDVAAFAGSVTFAAVLAAVEARDVASFIGKVSHTGILAAAEARDVAAVTGIVTHTGILAATEAKDAAAFTGSSTHLGTLAVTERRDIAAFAEAQLAFVGEVVAVEAPDTAAVIGKLTATGTLAASEAKDSAALRGGIVAQGTLAVSEARDTAAFTGSGLLGGILAATEQRDTAAVVGNARTLGVLAATEGQDRALFTSSTGWSGVLAATEARDSAAFVARADTKGVLVASEARDSAAFVAAATTDGILAATEEADRLIFVQTDIAGIIQAIEASDIVLFTGAVQDFSTDIIGDEDRPLIQGGCEGQSQITGNACTVQIKGSV